MLQMLEPTTFPMAMAPCPLAAAIELTINSGGAGAVGHHGQPDQQGRHPEPNGQRGAAAHQPFGTELEGHEARQ